MPFPETQIKAVHSVLRQCFKGQPKSTNKLYRPLPPHAPPLPDDLKNKDGKGRGLERPSQEKIEKRAADAAAAAEIMQLLRAVQPPTPVAYGYKVLDQPRLAGNCMEVSAAAAYVVDRYKIGAPWMSQLRSADQTISHAFCVVSDGTKPTVKRVEDFEYTLGSSWVIDIWMNICCPMKDYKGAFLAKTREWHYLGKEVQTLLPGTPRTAVYVDPNSILYKRAIFLSPVQFLPGGTSAPGPLPLALRRVPVEDLAALEFKPGPGNKN